jgi:hypothetical protein
MFVIREKLSAHPVYTSCNEFSLLLVRDNIKLQSMNGSILYVLLAVMFYHDKQVDAENLS